MHGFPYSHGLGEGHGNTDGHHLAGQLIAQELGKKLARAAGPGRSGVSRDSIGHDSIETSDINGSTIHALTTLLLDGYACGSS